jgi:hypothetical protein
MTVEIAFLGRFSGLAEVASRLAGEDVDPAAAAKLTWAAARAPPITITLMARVSTGVRLLIWLVLGGLLR